MRLYLETSTPNFLFVKDAPDKRAATERLFEQIRHGLHQAVVSNLYLEEVANTDSIVLRYLLEGIPTLYRLEVVRVTMECHELTELYLKAKAFTAPNLMDATHVAVAAYHGCEAVVSWNFQHIVREWTVSLVNQVHKERGLAPIRLCSPTEVISP